MYLQINIRSYGAVTLAGPTLGTSAGGTKIEEPSHILAVGNTR